MAGVGTELGNLIESAGVIPIAGCQCDVRKAELDIRGPAWARANLPTIVGWMRDEAKRQGWKLWSDRIAKWAVLIAVRRAERPAG